MRIFIFIFCVFALQAKPTICLNMIVRNETKVIERSLGSVKKLIDYWVIVDTGSTDGTQDMIRKFMKDIPGELHERPWVDFSHNRNEALVLAKGKGDYLLFIDADEIFEYDPNFALPPLNKDFFYMTVRMVRGADFKRMALINNHLNWKWVGVMHEVLQSPDAKTFGYLTGVINHCDSGPKGGRTEGLTFQQKYHNDAVFLENALKKEPENSRYAYYMGQSYFAAEEYEAALKAFQKRAAMKSNDVEETYMSLYNIGMAYDHLNELDLAIEAYFKAYEFRPIRAEPLFRAAKNYRQKGNYLLGYLLTQHALSMPIPEYDVYVEFPSYDYAILVEFANCTLLSGRYKEGLDASLKLLANPNLPEDIKPKVISNCEFAKKQLSILENAMTK